MTSIEANGPHGFYVRDKKRNIVAVVFDRPRDADSFHVFWTVGGLPSGMSTIYGRDSLEQLVNAHAADRKHLLVGRGTRG